MILAGNVRFIPAADAPHTDFVILLGADAIAAGLAWASGVIADVAHHTDSDVIRAAKLIEANDPRNANDATKLRKIIEKGRSNENHL